MTRRPSIQVLAIALCALSSSYCLAAVTPTSAELQQNSQWVQQNLLGGAPPFSFTYNGIASSSLLPNWTKTTNSVQLDAGRTQRNVTWKDPNSGLEVRCQSVEYANYPVVEWTTYLRNTGTANTPILQNIQGLNTTWTRTTGSEFKLQGVAGDNNSADSYKPYEYALGANSTRNFAPDGGRPTNGSMPYYNLSMPGGGVTLAVGWPGQWNTSFTRDSGNALRVTAGQASTNVSLRPGEEIRTPMIAMSTWQGADTVRAQNLWRRWMRQYSLPGATGQPMQPIKTQCTTGFYPGFQTSAAGEIAYAKKFVEANAKPDYWWLDAGWFPGSSWWQTGTWMPDPVRYPNGIKELSNYLHANGMKMLVWFEPERVMEGTWLMNTHPEWLLGSGGTRLLNMGNAAARDYLVNQIDGLITSQGIDLYRQDFNIDPLSYWQGVDAADRRGTTENAYVQGYLAFWDELRRRHPDMPIDSCASGGRRNDLETLRRSVPLLRSDYQYCPPYSPNATAAGMQCQLYGLASWIPYFGTGVKSDNDYMVRSHWSPSFETGIPQSVLDSAQGPDWEKYRRMQAEARMAADYMLGDYYPLTPYSQSENDWMAWQFDRSDLGGGMVQAFRRSQSQVASMTFRLSGLDPNAWYELMNIDTKAARKMLGSQLMQDGFLCEIGATSGSAVFTYQLVPEPSAMILTCIGVAGLWFCARRQGR